MLPGLADAGLTAEQQHLRLPGPGGLQRGAQRGPLGGPAGQPGAVTAHDAA
jgi:hypothetical protein